MVVDLTKGQYNWVKEFSKTGFGVTEENQRIIRELVEVGVLNEAGWSREGKITEVNFREGAVYRCGEMNIGRSRIVMV